MYGSLRSTAVLSLASWALAPHGTQRVDALSGLGRGGGVGGTIPGSGTPSLIAALYSLCFLCHKFSRTFPISFPGDSFVSKVMHNSLVAASSG